MDLEKIIREEIRKLLIEKYFSTRTVTKIAVPTVKRRKPKTFYSRKLIREMKSYVLENPLVPYHEVAKKFQVPPKIVSYLMVRYGKIYKHKLVAKARLKEARQKIAKEIETKKKLKEMEAVNKRSLAMQRFWSSPEGVKKRLEYSKRTKEWWQLHPEAREAQSKRMAETRRRGL